MSSDPHRQWRELLGAYLLGTLSAEEQTSLNQHLVGCAECSEEAAQLGRVVALLPAALPDSVEGDLAPSVHLQERVLSRIRQAQFAERKARRWRLGVGAGLAAALVSVVAVVLLRPGESPPVPGPEQVAFQALPPGAEATAEITSLPAATELRIRVRGLPGGEYVVAMERGDGTAVQGKPFHAPSGSWSGVREVALPRVDAVTVKLTQVGGETVLVAPLSPL